MAAKVATKPIDQDDQTGDDLLPILEAMLFAAHESLSTRRLARALGNVSEARVADGITRLGQQYDERRSPLMLAEIAGGWRLVTRPEFAPFLSRLFSKAEKERLSPAALETLAIVAYRQPATRAEIESVRGVQVSPLLKLLHERRLIKVVGRAEVVGRALQYGTTRRFLDHFGLGSLEDLPKVFPTGRPAPAAPTNGLHATNGVNGHSGDNSSNGAANGSTNGHAHAPDPVPADASA